MAALPVAQRLRPKPRSRAQRTRQALQASDRERQRSPASAECSAAPSSAAVSISPTSTPRRAQDGQGRLRSRPGHSATHRTAQRAGAHRAVFPARAPAHVCHSGARPGRGRGHRRRPHGTRKPRHDQALRPPRRADEKGRHGSHRRTLRPDKGAVGRERRRLPARIARTERSRPPEGLPHAGWAESHVPGQLSAAAPLRRRTDL